MNTTIQQLTEDTMKKFLRDTRNILACLKQTEDEVMEITSSYASLDAGMRDELSIYLDTVDQPHPYARKIAREDFSAVLKRVLSECMIICLANGSLTKAISFTKEAEDEKEELAFVSGCKPRPVVVPPKSPTELLEMQVTDDWRNLPVAVVKRKKNDPAYRKVFDRLMESGKLESQVTQSHDGYSGRVGS